MSSWFGEGISSITGQISNFTKEVLSEGREEVTDYEAELKLSTKKINELEHYCSQYKIENEKLQLTNSELEERFQSAELQVQSLSSQYRALLQNQAEVSSSSVNNEESLHLAHIKDLEEKLQTITDHHQAELATLQDHHSQQLALLRNQHQGSPEQTEEKDSTLLTHENEQLKIDVAQLKKEISGLEKCLVELDSQHQEAIEEVLAIKKNLFEENLDLKKKIQDYEDSEQPIFASEANWKQHVADLEDTISTLEKQIADKSHESSLDKSEQCLLGKDELEKLETDNETLKSQLKLSYLNCEQAVSDMTAMKAQYDAREEEFTEITLELEALRTEKRNSEEAINNLENTHLLDLQNCREQLTQTERQLQVKNNELQKENLKLSHLEDLNKNLMNEARQSQLENDSLKDEIDNLNLLICKYKEELKVVSEQIDNLTFKNETRLNDSDVQTDSLLFPDESYEMLQKELEFLKDKIDEMNLENEDMREKIKLSESVVENNLSCVESTQTDVEEVVPEHVHNLESQILVLQKDVELKSEDNLKLKNVIEQNLKEIDRLCQIKDELETKLKTQNGANNDKLLQAALNPNILKNLEIKIKDLEIEKEQMISVLNEKSRESSLLKNEVHKLVGIVSAEKKALDKLQQENLNLSKEEDQGNTKNIFEAKTLEFQTIIANKNEEIENLRKENESFLNMIQQNSPDTQQLLTSQNNENGKKYNELALKVSDFHEQNQKTFQIEWQEKLEKIEHEFANLTEKYETKQKQYININNEAIQLKQKLIESEKLYSNLQEKHQNTDEYMNVKQEDIAKYIKDMDDLKQTNYNQNEECEKMRNIILTREAEVSELSKRINLLVNQLKNSEQEYFANKNHLEQELQKNYNELFICKNYNAEISADIESKRSQIDALYEKLNQYSKPGTKTCGELENDLNKLSKELTLSKDREEKLTKQLTRLKEHLIQVEESYAHESLLSQKKEGELRNQLLEAQNKARLVEDVQLNNLQAQLSETFKEKEESHIHVSQLEEKLRQTTTSLSNLQMVLEHFHKERNRDVETLQLKHRDEIFKERIISQKMKEELSKKDQQIRDTGEALDAATRLSEQLDAKEELIQALKMEVKDRDHLVQKYVEELHSMYTNTEGKVDRQILKNLVLNYFTTTEAQKIEVMRILSKVLDFNEQEMSKVGIKVGKDRWISGWFNSNKPDALTDSQSFSAAFVKFLENESKPRPQVKCPPLTGSSDSPRRGSLPLQPYVTEPTSNYPLSSLEDILQGNPGTFKKD